MALFPPNLIEVKATSDVIPKNVNWPEVLVTGGIMREKHVALME